MFSSLLVQTPLVLIQLKKTSGIISLLCMYCIKMAVNLHIVVAPVFSVLVDAEFVPYHWIFKIVQKNCVPK